MSNRRSRGNMTAVLALAHAVPFGRQRSAYAHNVGGCAAPCPDRRSPTLPRGADGCTTGRMQCRQPVGINSGEVAAGASHTFTFTTRGEARPDELLYLGTEGAFRIDSVMIDGSEQQDGAISADTYGYGIDPHGRALDWPEIGPNRVVTMRITNVSDTADTFVGTLFALVARRV